MIGFKLLIWWDVPNNIRVFVVDDSFPLINWDQVNNTFINHDSENENTFKLMEYVDSITRDGKPLDTRPKPLEWQKEIIDFSKGPLPISKIIVSGFYS